ncbi:hypothetical protein, partial [Romboutsia sp. 13368]|uniref:hypothetical protein n=1 Tax=Romboutsia sp. 13368 TaxID=2708053 RepID=UPI002ED52D35
TITFNKDICISNTDLKILKKNIKIIIDENNIAIRLVTSWATREDAVDEFIEYMKGLRRVKVC